MSGNPGNLWNSESWGLEFVIQLKESGIRIQYLDPESMAWNPEFKITFHGTTP